MEGVEEVGGAWGALPHVPLLRVLEYLGRRDRVSASTTCVQWRTAALQLPLGDKLNLSIQKETDIPRTEFLAETFGRKVPEVKITFALDDEKCVEAVGGVLTVLEGNKILKNLKVVPLTRSGAKVSWDVIEGLSQKVAKVLEGRNRLERVGWPGNSTIETLEANPSKRNRVRSLFLAFAQRQPEWNVDCGVQRLGSFASLQVLSLNFSALSDDILRLLGTASSVGGLQQLNLVAVQDNQAISNAGWTAFVLNNGQAKVRFTVVGNEEMRNLLCPAIPISHFRAIDTCTLRMLDALVQWNQPTLEVLEVGGGQKLQTTTYERLDDLNIDPFVFAAWKCRRLHSIRIGFEYCGEDLLGIARLKGSSLLRLDIHRIHIDYPCRSKLIEVVSEALGRSWRPMGAGRKRKEIRHNPLEEILRVAGDDEI